MWRQTIFWPDAEACEATCALPKGHVGDHCDEILGTWSEDEMLTNHSDADEIR